MKALTLIIVLFCIQAQSAILIEEGYKPAPVESSTSTSIQSITASKDEYLAFASSYDIRKAFKMAFGTAIGGQVGTFGFKFDINFDPLNTFVGGFGGGSGFRTVQFGYKAIYDGQFMTPYWTASLVNWSNASGNLDSAMLEDVYLNQTEKQTNAFNKTFAVPSIGVQYTQLNGPFVGTTLFAETMLFVDFQDFKSALNGTLGITYLF